MIISGSTKSLKHQNLLVASVVICLGLASFVINPPPALAEPPSNHNYRQPLPLIVSRSLPVSSPSHSETPQDPDTQPAFEVSPQPDGEWPAGSDSGNIGVVVDPPVPDVHPRPVDEIAVLASSEMTPTGQLASPAADPTRVGLGTGDTRAVLWGIVASMSTLLVLGSLIFRQAESGAESSTHRPRQ